MTKLLSFTEMRKLNYGTAIVGTVSGDSILLELLSYLKVLTQIIMAAVFDSSNSKIVVAYRDRGNSNAGTAIVGTVSGTSMSLGSPVVFESGNTNNSMVSFDTSANKVVIAFRDTDDSNYGKAIVGTVSGTSISFGSPATFNSATTTLHFYSI